MKTKYALAALALLIVGGETGGGPAMAADIDQRSDPNYAQPVSEGSFSWTGFYLGGRIGYGNANHEVSLEEYHGDYCFDQFGNQLSDGEAPVNSTVAPEDTFDPLSGGGLPFKVNSLGTCANEKVVDARPNGGIGADDSIAIGGSSRDVASLDGLNSSGITGGFQVGFDKQIGQRLVVGVFGSYDLSSMETTATLLDTELSLIEKGDEWSVGARFGYLLHPRVMAYILAAYTQADWEFITEEGGKREVTFDGVTVGGGLEYALTRNVFLGIEGTHTFYGKETVFDLDTPDENDPAGRGARINDEIGETKVLGTLKVKLDPTAGLLD